MHTSYIDIMTCIPMVANAVNIQCITTLPLLALLPPPLLPPCTCREPEPQSAA